ncbi:MHYT domain-containing protein [Streptosporangium lutulentum]|uniref:NO-binding membrane sensor protein with MHYT domain n=1 Tax=Streptosporangium lutulentum TaxID=1461250 RepID=A0ABT9QCK2_9ACTN|nr:MHYT domain-containing protein [Streptosporangium lutulentum]MDP9844424.1 NO-binding membrane sensor protein with MHYT domain [Streptosporangium lutulentum]
MPPVDHFAHGFTTPAAAYVMSSIGCLLGLLLAARAREAGGRSRTLWLASAALSIGGTGIWVMHFIAMMGFNVRGTAIRYDVPLTIASALLAVVVVGAGLFLVSAKGTGPLSLISGGLLTGLGVAGMHYLGMAGMNMSAHVSYDPLLVALSLLIAVVAATVALWFSLRATGALAITGAALLMGVAVNGMHYTGMFAMDVTVHDTSMSTSGASAMDFMLPLIIGISLLTLGLLLTIFLSPSEKEMREDAALLSQFQRPRDGVAGSVPPPGADAGRPAEPRAPSLFDSADPGH